MDTAARHLERDGVNGALTWTSKYGSVVAGAFDMISVHGLNEAGLAGHVWLAESDYGTPDSSRTQLGQAVWMQYFLDNFATVDEVAAWVQSTDVQVVQMIDPTGGKPPAIHLALGDATGDSCIIEYREGKPKVFHSRDYVVMTNSTTYDKQLELAKMITGLGGDQPIPGSTLASDRFARASYYVSRLERPKTELQAVAGMFSVIRNAAQPFRAPDLGKPEASQTLWQTVSDLTNKRYVFASTTRPNVVWVELDQPQPHPTPTTTPLRTTPSSPKLSQTPPAILRSDGVQQSPATSATSSKTRGTSTSSPWPWRSSCLMLPIRRPPSRPALGVRLTMSTWWVSSQGEAEDVP